METTSIKVVFDTILMMIKNKEPLDEIEKYMYNNVNQLSMNQTKGEIDGCVRCSLSKTEIKVPGGGSVGAKIMIVGEAPGEQESKEGRPFVGPAGQLLNKIIKSAKWKREDLYITNTIKCRPHVDNKNVQPNTEQIAACIKHLKDEIQIIKPKVVICLGSVAANTLIHPNFKISQEHGKWFEINEGIKAMAIFHPSYILHKGEGTNEEKAAKLLVWNDILKVISYLNSIK